MPARLKEFYYINLHLILSQFVINYAVLLFVCCISFFIILFMLKLFLRGIWVAYVIYCTYSNASHDFSLKFGA